MTRVAAVIALLMAALGAVKLWSSVTAGDWSSAAIMVSAGLGAIVVAWIVRKDMRNRQRRRMMETRDSALW